MKHFILAVLLVGIFLPGKGLNYRTKASGNFSSAAIWEYHNGVSYVPAISAPVNGEHNINIRAAHTVTLDVDIEFSDNVNFDSPDLTINGKLIFSGSHYVEGEDDISPLLPGVSQFRLNDGGEIETQSGAPLLSNSHTSNAHLRGFANYTFEPLCDLKLTVSPGYSLPSQVDSVHDLHILPGSGILSTSQNLTINGTLTVEGKFNFNHRLTINGPSIVDWGTISTGSNAELFYVSGYTPQYLPNDIISLRKLRIAGSTAYFRVNLNNKLSITAANGLILDEGVIQGTDTLFLLNDAPVNGNGSSYVEAPVAIDVETASSASFEYITFPVGEANIGYQPLRMNVSTSNPLGSSKTRVAVQLFPNRPSGSPDYTTLSGIMQNVYWRIRVIPTSSLFSTNYIHTVANLEVQVGPSIYPTTLSSAKLAFSADNTINSFVELPTSVSLPYLNSLSLSSTQKNDLASANGSWIGISNDNSLTAGSYCIGPSASYTAPLGQSAYINASNPYNSIDEAFQDLNLKGAWGHVKFILQNNYSGSAETGPIWFKYRGEPNRVATLGIRSDLLNPRVISMNRANDNIGMLHFFDCSYVTIDGSMLNVACSAGKGIELINTGIESKNIYLGYNSDHITIRGMRIKCHQDGTAVYVNGVDYPTIECNLFEPFDITLNSGHGIRTGSFGTYDLSIQNNHFNGYLNPIVFNEGDIVGNTNISGNSFYRNFTGTANRFLLIDTYTGGSLNIQNNYFGGSAANAGGNKLNIYGMKPGLLKSTYPAVCSFSGNHFHNMYNNTSINDSMDLLEVRSGFWTIDGNTFGNPLIANDISSTTNLSFTALEVDMPGTSGSDIINNSFNNISFTAIANSPAGSFYGIKAVNHQHLNIQNNEFHNIEHGAGQSFYLVHGSTITDYGISSHFRNNVATGIKQTSLYPAVNLFRIAGNNWYCAGNEIGDTGIPNDVSINALSPVLFNTVFNAGYGDCTVDSNRVRNIICNHSGSSKNIMIQIEGNVYSNYTVHCRNNYTFNINSNSAYTQSEANAHLGASLNGFNLKGTAKFNVQDNFVYNLSNTQQLLPTSIIGMQLSIDGDVSRNQIFRLRNAANASPTFPYLIGMNVCNGNYIRLVNNRIGLSNRPHTGNVNIFGIRKHSSNTKLLAYHNTVYIGGSATWGTCYALFKVNVMSNTDDTLLNNIFMNERVSSDVNAALGCKEPTASHWGVCNYNNLFSGNANQLCQWGPGTYLNFEQWKLSTGKDADSKNGMVNFGNPLNDDYYLLPNNCVINNTGLPGIGVGIDINAYPRDISKPDIGAEEIAFPFTIVATVQDTTVCAITQPIQLLCTPGSAVTPSFTWQGPSGFTSSQNSPVIQSATTSNQGVYTVTVVDANGCSSSATSSVSVVNCSDYSIPVKVFLEGYYNGSGLMTPALWNQGVSNNTTLSDSVTIELRNPTPPYTAYLSQQGLLGTDGRVYTVFPSGIQGNYYIVIRHRNALVTWSAVPEFVTANTTYDFTSHINKAYGNNMKELEPGVWGLYSGDLIPDENLDLVDLGLLEADIQNFMFGYVATDLNGDGNVDLSDLPFIESNINNFVFGVHP